MLKSFKAISLFPSDVTEYIWNIKKISNQQVNWFEAIWSFKHYEFPQIDFESPNASIFPLWSNICLSTDKR